jgi:hypothetical protein
LVNKTLEAGLAAVIASQTGSRECAPDDRLREAIHAATSGAMDCFVAEFIIGPAEGGTRWLLAMTVVPRSSAPRLPLHRKFALEAGEVAVD